MSERFNLCLLYSPRVSRGCCSSWVVDEDIVLISQCGYMEGAEDKVGLHMCLLAIVS